MRFKAKLDISLDVFDDDDCVVDNNPDRQHQAEEGKIVQRKAHRRHRRKCANE